MNRLIRYRLLTIVLLGVLTSAMSVLALVQLLTTSTSQRVDRARDAVVDEVDRIASQPSQLSEPTPTAIVALRAGVWTGEQTPLALPAPFVDQVRTAVASARAGKRRVVTESPAAGGSTMITAARPVIDPRGLPADATVFAVYVVRPLPSLRTWQEIVAALAALTVLLVGTAVYSVVTVNRGAAALRGSLAALASDLRAPVPRPSVRELDAIADGIAELAQKLADARVKEEQLARELAQNERLAALGRVAAGVAHEVRNPLASIKLRLDLAVAASAPALPPAVEKAVAHATSEIERLDRLVADLLVVAGRAVGPKGRADLGVLVRARVDGLAHWAEERGVVLAVSGEGDSVIDPDSTARAIDNLLRNAIEASPAGKHVEVRVSEEDARIVVRVSDSGPGVATERASELFEPFFTTKPAGTGLGLAISRAIARAQGGDVVYARSADVSCFTLTVPAISGDVNGERRAA